MHGKRTEGWYVTRILLAIGIGMLLASAFLAWWMPEPFSDDRPAVALGPLLIPASVFVRGAALAIACVGLVWMLRIYRGPRDEPPPWRYRDR